MGARPVTVDEVIQELVALDCRIIGGASPKVHPPERVELRKRFERLKEWLPRYRTEILAHFEPPAPRQLCPLCSRDVTDPEDKERLEAVNPWCEWGGTPAGFNRFYQKPIPAKPGCPYRKAT